MFNLEKNVSCTFYWSFFPFPLLFLLDPLLSLLSPIQIAPPPTAGHLPLFPLIIPFWHLLHCLYYNCWCICILFYFVDAWRAEAELDLLLCIQCKNMALHRAMSMCFRMSRHLNIFVIFTNYIRDDTNKFVFSFVKAMINFPFYNLQGFFKNILPFCMLFLCCILTIWKKGEKFRKELRRQKRRWLEYQEAGMGRKYYVHLSENFSFMLNWAVKLYWFISLPECGGTIYYKQIRNNCISQ